MDVNEPLKRSDYLVLPSRTEAEIRGARLQRQVLAVLDRGAEYDPTCIFCETGEEPGHEH